jgi:FOG: CheY-like receiver
MEKVILVIDDDADDRELFREALHEVYRNARFITANNGYDALELFNKPGHLIPDFIFLDLNMPKVDGRQCLMRLRQIPGLQKVPIIIFSTMKLVHEVDELKLLGASMCITKPVWYDDLRRMLREVIVSSTWKTVNPAGKK